MSIKLLGDEFVRVPYVLCGICPMRHIYFILLLYSPKNTFYMWKIGHGHNPCISKAISQVYLN